MKDVRPSTWVLLGVLVLIIFGPLFLLDIDPIQKLEPANNAPNIRPSDPRANRPANHAGGTPSENTQGPKGRLPDDSGPENRPVD